MINKATSWNGGYRGHNFAYKPRCRNAADAGFTLVEMLVVLLLTATMSALMIAGLRQMHAFTQLEKRQTAQTELDAVADYMASELAGALPLALSDHDGDGFVPMIGDAGSTRFVAVVRTGFLMEDLREVSYFIEKSPTGLVLLRNSQPHLWVKQSRYAGGDVEKLYTGLKGASITYLVKSDAKESGATVWLNEWKTEVRLPLAVRVKLYRVYEGIQLQSIRIIMMAN